MKYIKTFEAWPNYIEFYSLKKYVIYKTVSNNYLAVELVESLENFKILIKSLKFVKKDRIYNPQGYIKEREFEIDIHSLREKIVFQSDDLEEIRNQIELLNQTDKFNI